jgi:hypothetical protein
MCEYCEDLSNAELDWESPDDPMHGEEAECGECGAIYYREYSGKLWAVNGKAVESHPNLKLI